MATLAELLSVRTPELEERSLLSRLKSAEFPVTDWEPGGAAQTMVKILGAGFADKSALIAAVTAGGIPSLAKDLAEPSWLDMLAEGFFGTTRSRATYTKQRCVLACEPGLGPQTINAGFTVRAIRTGNLYRYEGPALTVPDGAGYFGGPAAVAMEVTAESPGSDFHDPTGTITEIVTPLPGVSVNNPPVPFGGMSGATAMRNPANRGSGAVTPSGAPTIPRMFTVRILASGVAGVGGKVEIEWLTDGVRSSAQVTPIPTTWAGAGDSVVLTFTSGAGAGFIRDDSFTFETLGSPVLAAGVDDERQELLARRLIARWPSLGLNATTEKYVAWIQQCSLENSFGIEKITPSPSFRYAGQTNLVVATALGDPGAFIVNTLQAYVNARDGITDTAVISGASNINIAISGSVTVRTAEAAAAKSKADDLWLAYIEGVPIGGDTSTGSPGVVRLSELVQAVMDAGAVDYANLQINGAAANLALTELQVPVIPSGQQPSVALTWIEVA